MRPQRARTVLAVADLIRDAHPALQHAATVATLRRALTVEEIAVLRRPMRALAYVEGALGSFVIVLRAGLSPAQERRALAHEYAHIRLHYTEADEVQYQRAACQPGDPRELEAQLLVRLLELGPAATPDHPKIAPLVAALEGPRYRAALPAQTRLELPEQISATPRIVPAKHIAPLDEWRSENARLVRHGARRAPTPIVRTRDAERIEWRHGVPIFTDVADRRWRITDYGPVLERGRYVLGPVRAAARETAIYRKFTNAAGARRVYTFPDARELRAIAVAHLDRQLAASRRVRPRAQHAPRPARTQRSFGTTGD